MKPSWTRMLATESDTGPGATLALRIHGYKPVDAENLFLGVKFPKFRHWVCLRHDISLLNYFIIESAKWGKIILVPLVCERLIQLYKHTAKLQL